MNAAITITDVCVVVDGAVILPKISVTVPDGKITGLLGPSGAGKTTLMRLIVGLQKPKSGNAVVLGKPAGTPGLRPLVGYVTQSPSVYLDLSVAENLHYFAAMVGVDRERVSEVIETVQLSKHAGQLAGSLSGGQRARVSLAVALLGRPKLLVLDEPTVGLDPLLRQELWEQFHELARGGTTILVSSHVMDEAKRCDNLVLMRDGAVLAAGTPAELMATTGARDIESAFLHLVGAHA